MKNFIANLFLAIGLMFQSISKGFFNISFKLHIIFNTKTGVKLKELEDAYKALAKATKVSKSSAAAQLKEDRRLVDILNGANNEQSTKLDS